MTDDAAIADKKIAMTSLEERSRLQRQRMDVHRAKSFVDAEAWDLDFWQRCTPEERLSALVAIHREVELVRAAKDEASSQGS
jgi:hypothetical protein